MREGPLYPLLLLRLLCPCLLFASFSRRPSSRPRAPCWRLTPLLFPLPPGACSYASSDRAVVQQMSGVDAFGQMSAVALKVGGASGWVGGSAWVGPARWTAVDLHSDLTL